MAALTVAPGAEVMVHSGAPPFALGAAVAAGALLVLFLALLASLYDQRLNVLVALDAGGVGYWELALPSMVLQVSPLGKALLGRDPGAPFGLPALIALLPPAERERHAQALEAAIAERREYEADIRLTGPDGLPRWVNMRGRALGQAGRRPGRMVGVVFDVTEQQEAFAAVADSERRQRALVDELNHRVKNTLAAVQSISRHSAKGARSMDDFRDLFEARLVALSQTHNALTHSAWQHARLGELVRQQLAPYPPEQVWVEGAELDLAPREALALGMVFHELATNAAKYGALSTPGGRVRVTWRLADADAERPQLVLEWAESGGPPVVAPTRRGFGTRMVQGSVVGELGGAAKLAFEPEGFNVRMEIPLDRRRVEAAA